MDKQRWQQLSLSEQLGNIGSEISRARHWDKHNDRDSRNKALERILEYLDFMLDDKRLIGRIKELARFREVIGDWYCDQQYYEISLEALESYCIFFAMRARQDK